MYRKPTQLRTTFRTVPKMLSNDADLTPNIEARHMPHTRYTTVFSYTYPPSPYFLDRLNGSTQLYRFDPDRVVYIGNDSAAHGLTQYPAPMSDGNTYTKPGGEVPDQGAESVLHEPETRSELGGAR